MARRLLVVAALLVAFAIGCSKAAPTPTSGRAPTATSIPTLAPQATSTPTLAFQATPTGTPALSGASVTPGALFLEVTAPENESVVRLETVDVKGRTTPDAVVSVNGETAPVAADGVFTVHLRLPEGPSAVEVIASNFQGEQEYKVISVVYVR